MTALFLVAVLVLVLLNGFFVAAEFAFVRARAGQLEAEAELEEQLRRVGHERDDAHGGAV